MPLTRTQRKEALKYVLLTVMDQSEDGPVMRALADASIEIVDDLMGLVDLDIDAFSYVPTGETNRIDLVPSQRGLLRGFCAYIRYRARSSTPIGDTWTSITKQEFDDFRISDFYNGTIFGQASNPGLPTSSNPRARDPVADFKRGIKRDPSQFSVLKEERQWDGWNRTNIAQAKAQDVEEIMVSYLRPGD